MNFETKPYEILQDNIEFLQNELRSKDEIIKTWMKTQTAVLENLPLSKPPQQTEKNLSFRNSPQGNVNQVNQSIVFKRQPNQLHNNQSQHYVINNQSQKISKQQNRNHYQKFKEEKRFYIYNLNTFAIFLYMPEHIQKELLKLYGIKFHGNKIIIEEATSKRIKRPDEQNTQPSTTKDVNDSSRNVDLIRANTVPGSKP